MTLDTASRKQINLDILCQALYIKTTFDSVLVVSPRACGKGRLGFFLGGTWQGQTKTSL
jgi:hypothetical protein